MASKTIKQIENVNVITSSNHIIAIQQPLNQLASTVGVSKFFK